MSRYWVLDCYRSRCYSPHCNLCHLSCLNQKPSGITYQIFFTLCIPLRFPGFPSQRRNLLVLINVFKIVCSSCPSTYKLVYECKDFMNFGHAESITCARALQLPNQSLIRECPPRICRAKQAQKIVDMKRHVIIWNKRGFGIYLL